MSDLDLDKIWQSVLLDVKNSAHVASFRTWFEKSSLSKIESDKAVVTLSSNFAIAYIKKHFDKIIKETISDHLGYPIKNIDYLEIKRETISKKPIDPLQPALIDFPLEDQVSVLQQVKIPSSITLNEKYTFQTFIVGNKNRLAHAASLAVAKSPGVAYNPLYIYGGVGLGKTHLMQAIGHEILRNNPDKKVIYVSCETFLNEMISAIQTGSVEKFKRKYRNIDVFLVDDIQFIAGKETTQEEFFHTYNALHQTDKQIVITSDKAPQEIPKLESRLSSRFAAGMIADIQPPDLEMRIAILQRKSLENNQSIDSKLLEIIAETIDSNIRELEGALTTVLSYIQFNNLDMRENSIREALKHFSQSGGKKTNRPNVSLIRDIICDFYKIQSEDISSPRRNKELVYPRQIFMYLLKTELSLSFPNIGKEVGGRDHTTVIYGVDKIEKELKKNTDFQEEMKEIKSRFYNA